MSANAHALRLVGVTPAGKFQPIAAAGLPITVRGLRKSFGANEVLRGIDLQIAAGEFVAVVGRSGCGKSTLLRLLAGLDRSTSGTIRLGDAGVDIPERNAVRVMFQEPRLLPWARVLANVEVGLGETRNAPGARDQACAALREVGLEARGGDWPSVLSGGQRQRVALARALVSRPKILAFDEPLGALDALTRISMQQLLERVWLEQGFTAMLVTHDVAEAVTLADRVVVIDNGVIALNLRLDPPRPRERGSSDVAKLEGRILRELLRDSRPGEDA
jgi:sulfonate transport system ATP-binding protein